MQLIKQPFDNPGNIFSIVSLLVIDQVNDK